MFSFNFQKKSTFSKTCVEKEHRNAPKKFRRTNVTVLSRNKIYCSNITLCLSAIVESHSLRWIITQFQQGAVKTHLGTSCLMTPTNLSVCAELFCSISGESSGPDPARSLNKPNTAVFVTPTAKITRAPLNGCHKGPRVWRGFFIPTKENRHQILQINTP